MFRFWNPSEKKSLSSNINVYCDVRGHVIDPVLRGRGLFIILTAWNSHQKQGTKPLKLVFVKGFIKVKKFGWKISFKNDVPLPPKYRVNYTPPKFLELTSDTSIHNCWSQIFSFSFSFSINIKLNLEFWTKHKGVRN